MKYNCTDVEYKGPIENSIFVTFVYSYRQNNKITSDDAQTQYILFIIK